ncbi:hypothetical protein FEZ32_11380 [Acidipropionibacterium jensenii]|uniref:hypothetical protein n=1 Tax=Acidipropionibacterium jensenii TaxID=1749 RepID=UPI00110B33DA|nr:hypothetical protein [Acidipropionibacterium jensenii]QCV88869.1 hypothetical protein FEZ32_11380 [Acidipropionibacterium jensenii]
MSTMYERPEPDEPIVLKVARDGRPIYTARVPTPSRHVEIRSCPSLDEARQFVSAIREAVDAGQFDPMPEIDNTEEVDR